jgi:hypothetical protein
VIVVILVVDGAHETARRANTENAKSLVYEPVSSCQNSRHNRH